MSNTTTSVVGQPLPALRRLEAMGNLLPSHDYGPATQGDLCHNVTYQNRVLDPGVFMLICLKQALHGMQGCLLTVKPIDLALHMQIPGHGAR